MRLEKTTCENLFVNYDVETSKENYDFYQVGNGDSIFTETVKKNKIDKDYNEELLSATTTAEYTIIEKSIFQLGMMKCCFLQMPFQII